MVRIGILGASEIAHRMFVPAVRECPGIRCVGVAANAYDSTEKKRRFIDEYSIPVMDEPDSFAHMIEREDVDALYIPQPPALHYEWAERALRHGKHVFVEKPSTTRYALTQSLAELAARNGLTIHENYMFQYHAQLTALRRMLTDGLIGEVRLYRAAFGFPLRAQTDFRYNRALGGGALLDCGGYVVKLATLLLGESIKLESATCGHLPGYEVDMLGSVHVSDGNGPAFQGAFGMDCHYQCALEIWGSKGKLTAGRIFTAPPGLTPPLLLETADGQKPLSLPADNHFRRSLEVFLDALTDKEKRNTLAKEMLLQARLIEEIQRYTGEDNRL